MSRARSPRAAFTFMEVFAAMIFLAILVPAIVEGLTMANKASVIAERSAIAGQLAENKLNEVVLAATTGTSTGGTVESSGSSGGSGASLGNSGDFGSDYPGYRWEVDQETWDQDYTNTMTQVSVQVYYTVQGKERSVTLATLVSGSAQLQSSP